MKEPCQTCSASVLRANVESSPTPRQQLEGFFMGRDVPSITVTQQDRRAYREKVRQCLDVFARMLRESRFETEPRQVGLEIELNLVDPDGMPSMSNLAALEAIADPNWASELGRFNLEINVPPRQLTGDALTLLEDDVGGKLAAAAARTKDTGSRLVMIGILPTLRQADVTDDAMSANPRYRLLNEQMIAARGEDMRISIDDPSDCLPTSTRSCRRRPVLASSSISR